MKKIGKFIWQWKLFSLAIIALLASLPLYFTGLHTATYIILGTVSLIEVIPLLWEMITDLRSGSYGIDILAATAIVAAVFLRQYWAAIVVVIMLTSGKSLEDYADRRALSELNNLLSHAPTSAHLIKNKKQVDVKASEIKIGDVFIVKPGESVPTDGVIISGQSSFDESSLTGESIPLSKGEKELLLSGSINLDSPVTVKSTASAQDSQYQQIIKLVESAAASRAPFVRLADKYSIPFSLVAYAIAGSVWALSGHAIRFLEVIIVATPCPLLLAAPIALISGMSSASRLGIIVKTGSALEQLAQAKTIAFDKTGTLTSAKLKVNKVVSFNGFNNQDVLTYAASLEQFSNHVIAKTVISEAQKEKMKLVKVKGLKEIAGFGLKASLKGQTLVVGRARLLEQEGIKLPGSLSRTKQANTIVFIGLADKLVGYINLVDQMRPEANKTFESLRKLGAEHFLLVTGDNRQVAESVGSSLGIKDITADALPADKLNTVENYPDRPIAFVGDGVNDAPVLAASDIGIALGAKGSTAASESADMVIMLDDLSRVAIAYSIAKHTFKIARQSILFGIGLSVILMIVFASGHFLPVYGAVLQEVVDVVVIFNALRAHTTKYVSETI